jgi:hypothetical protein
MAYQKAQYPCEFLCVSANRLGTKDVCIV